MSYTEFISAARKTAITSWKLVERRRRALAAGIMDTKKQRISTGCCTRPSGRTPAESSRDLMLKNPRHINREDYIKKINGKNNGRHQQNSVLTLNSLGCLIPKKLSNECG
jgi:hypothetical protein